VVRVCVYYKVEAEKPLLFVFKGGFMAIIFQTGRTQQTNIIDGYIKTDRLAGGILDINTQYETNPDTNPYLDIIKEEKHPLYQWIKIIEEEQYGRNNQ